MSTECLLRLSTFAKWPMPESASVSSGSGITVTNFVSKASAAHFERSEECVDDEVVCDSCGIKFRNWNGESPAVVHRVISPKCPALNPISHGNRRQTENEVIDFRSLQQNPFLKYLPDHIQNRVFDCERNVDFTSCSCTLSTGTTSTEASRPEGASVNVSVPEAAFRSPSPKRTSTYSAQDLAPERARRVLFSDHVDERNAPQERRPHDTRSETSRNRHCNSVNLNAIANTGGVLQTVSQCPIAHPFKTKFGGYNFLFASERKKTFPPPINCPKHHIYAEDGFAFRKAHGDVICVYCGTMLVLNGHQPRVAHKKACPTCPFVMGIDVGNITEQQEKDIRLKYIAQQATKNQNGLFDCMIKYPQYEKLEDRKGTFQSWPKIAERMFPSDGLASAGFYYSGFSDKVVCYSCGKELADWSEEDADVWKTHARVSPTCLHVINQKGQEFIDQAVNIQVSVEVQHSKKGSGSSQKGMTGEIPGSAHLDTTAIEAAFARGYTIPQIHIAIVKFFRRTSLYPNEAILIAALKGDSEYQATVCRQQQLVQEKDTQLQHKDTQLQQAVQAYQDQIAERHELLNTVTAKDEQLNAQGEQLNAQGEQLNAQGEQLNAQGEQLNAQGEQLSRQALELHLQDQQIRSLMQQVQQLRTDQHRNVVNPAAEAQDVNSNLMALRAENEILRERMRCKICDSDKPRMIFLPCGHLYCCAKCTSHLLPDRRCPVCRQDISDILPAFVA